METSEAGRPAGEQGAYNPPPVNERRPLPDRIHCRADVDALLAAATNYEERLPRDPLKKALNLGRVRALLASIGNPQEGPRTVHVAGSKGKGTVARLIAAGLRHAASGPVGLYTSPHLEDLAERIDVDGEPASGEALARAADAILPHIRRTQGSREAPTFFEIFTAIAWGVFREAGCTEVVLETGLGGRLDATTVCHPTVTVITTIELEHTRLLGDTLRAIAGEKAGILKAGVPVVTTATGKALGVIADRALEVGAPLLALADIYEDLKATSDARRGIRFELDDGEGESKLVHLPLPGVHHAPNAVAAFHALRILGQESDVAWRGLATASLPGLLEPVASEPLVLIDSAHTPRSAEATRRALADGWPEHGLVLVLGILEEKDVEGIVRALAKDARHVLTTQVTSPRAIPATQLARQATAWLGRSVEACPEPAAALARARTLAGPEDLVLCSGSVYLAGTVRTLARA